MTISAARTGLIIQNSCNTINAVLLIVVLYLKFEILAIWNGGLYILCQAMIIFLGTFGAMANLAQKICIMKDWVVVVAGKDLERSPL